MLTGCMQVTKSWVATNHNVTSQVGWCVADFIWTALRLTHVGLHRVVVCNAMTWADRFVQGLITHLWVAWLLDVGLVATNFTTSLLLVVIEAFTYRTLETVGHRSPSHQLENLLRTTHTHTHTLPCYNLWRTSVHSLKYGWVRNQKSVMTSCVDVTRFISIYSTTGRLFLGLIIILWLAYETCCRMFSAIHENYSYTLERC